MNIENKVRNLIDELFREINNQEDKDKKKIISIMMKLEHYPDEIVNREFSNRLGLKNKKIRNIRNAVKNMLYFSNTGLKDLEKIFKKYPALLEISEEVIWSKLKWLNSFCSDKTELVKIIEKSPDILLYSVDKKLGKTMKFLVEEVKIKPKVIMEFPFIFRYSLKEVLKPRWVYIKPYREKLTERDIITLLTTSEYTFPYRFCLKIGDNIKDYLHLRNEKRWIEKFKNNVPQEKGLDSVSYGIRCIEELYDFLSQFKYIINLPKLPHSPVTLIQYLQDKEKRKSIEKLYKEFNEFLAYLYDSFEITDKDNIFYLIFNHLSKANVALTYAQIRKRVKRDLISDHIINKEINLISYLNVMKRTGLVEVENITTLKEGYILNPEIRSRFESGKD